MVKWGESISQNKVLIDKDKLHKLKQESEVLQKIKDAFEEEYETTEPWHPDKLLSQFGNEVGEILYEYMEEENNGED